MLKHNYKIIGIVTCYNRVNSTRLFLESFFDLKRGAQVDLKLYLLDEEYPSVQLINSHGGNYWAGGMRLIFQKIDKTDFIDYTHLFVLNDDIVLKTNALLDALNELEKSSWINPLMPYTAVMSMFDEELGRVVYGGLRNQSRFGGFIYNVIDPTERIILAETLNMNAALISRGAINLIGFLDKNFAHHRADIDFGLRLSSGGGKVLVIPGIHGLCTLNSYRSFNYISEKNLYRRLKMITHPKNEPILERFIFYWRHSNFFGLIFFLNPYLTIFFPFLRYCFLENRILLKQKRSN